MKYISTGVLIDVIVFSFLILSILAIRIWQILEEVKDEREDK